MQSVLKVTDEIKDQVNHVKLAEKKHVRAIVRMMKESKPVKSKTIIQYHCPVCHYEEVNIPHHFGSELVWPSMAKHALIEHKVWSPEHHAIAMMLLGETPVMEAKGSSKDEDIFSGMNFDEIASEVIGSEDETQKKSVPRRNNSKRSSKTKRLPYRGEDIRLQSGNQSRLPPANPTGELHPHPMAPQQQALHYQGQMVPYGQTPPQEGGLMSQITGMFSNLFGGAVSQAPHPHLHPHSHHQGNGGGFGPPAPQHHPETIAGEWYPDPGLKAQLTAHSGQSFGPGSVPPGQYHVEVHNGQGFTPISTVDVHPQSRYRLFIGQEGQVRWGEM